jgi:cytochrome b561
MIRLRDGQGGWGLVTRGLHWLVAALILLQIGLGVWMTRIEPDLLRRFALTQTHKSWGVVIFALVAARLAWRLGGGTRPPLPPTMPPWQRVAAPLAHGGLYALMLAMPVAGWVLASASPAQDLLQIENRVFGGFSLPDPWRPGNAALAGHAATAHTVGALLLAVLVALHTGAALWHQFVIRDGILAGMTFGNEKGRALQRGPERPARQVRRGRRGRGGSK